MWELKACTVCFSTGCKLYHLESGENSHGHQLRSDFLLACGLKDADLKGMPRYLCVECTAHVRNSKKFREKCKRANYALKEILKADKQITEAHLHLFQGAKLGMGPNLSYLDLNKAHFLDYKFKWEKPYRDTILINEQIPIFYYGTKDDEKSPNNLSNEIKIEVENEISNADAFANLVQEFASDNNDLKDNFLEPSTSQENDDSFYYGNDTDTFDADDQNDKEDEKEADGINLDEEYATVIPLSMKESQAALEVYKLFSNSNVKCEICQKGFLTDERLKVHMRMHDRHISGNFECGLCHMYYKTEFLLKVHMSDRHIYKYVCTKCPEVNFDRKSAKQHYIWAHLQYGKRKRDAAWFESRPSWVGKKGLKGPTAVVKLRPVKKMVKLPADFPTYTPISQEEQYQLVEDRKKTRNYIEAVYKCELCYRGFREAATYNKHMRKHDPKFSGRLQCDVCKQHFRDTRKLYKHMITTHLFKYTCQPCKFVCYSRSQAHTHYRWHKNVTYDCPQCGIKFKKASTRLTHIRIKHPSTNICSICGHSFVSEQGLYCHKKISHTKEEIERSEAMQADPSDPRYCAECDVHLMSDIAFKTHLGSSSKHASVNLSSKPRRIPKSGQGVSRTSRPRAPPRRPDIVNNGIATATNCELCNTYLVNDVQARKHYEAEHPGADFLKRYMCDVCGHTTKQYANLMVHMRTHTNEKPYGCPHCERRFSMPSNRDRHLVLGVRKTAYTCVRTNEKPYGCPHCERRFSMPSNRDRHLVVHTGEKRYQCQHCSRRFTQSSAVKLHIQTVHLKIPYAPWDKKNRKRRKEMEAAIPMTAPTLPQPKLVLDPSGDYLNAYISYND